MRAALTFTIGICPKWTHPDALDGDGVGGGGGGAAWIGEVPAANDIDGTRSDTHFNGIRTPRAVKREIVVTIGVESHR